MLTLYKPSFSTMAQFFREHFKSKVDVFTVQENGKDVGGMLVIDNEMTNLYVDEPLRNRGIATTLISMAKLRYDNLTLVCGEPLINFYERHSFKYFYETPDKLGHRMYWSKS